MSAQERMESETPCPRYAELAGIQRYPTWAIPAIPVRFSLARHNPWFGCYDDNKRLKKGEAQVNTYPRLDFDRARGYLR